MIRTTFFFFLILGMSVSGFAQFGSVQPGPAPSTQAIQIPLSGRSPQGGAVTVTQSPIPGTTTSVNTINPSIQVEGPYNGSTPGTQTTPFNGRLTLQDAMDRGFGFNLGPVGLNDLLRQATARAKVIRSSLLPNVTGNVTEALQQ